ncbi:hypothetical protein [Deinococcus ficus]|uniref:Uncharacterized protein n=1 Tax=Deinococcus ficus TaxID=317577 RepID=A0A221T3A6_9DEIO|nr:hypothetical protein [Deinococcus ficus]ASN83326.1 hypothetical protein DFI_19200 [Deinococcus ficus]
MSWIKNKKKAVEERLEPLTGKLEPLSAPPRQGPPGIPAQPTTAALGTAPAVNVIPGVEVGEEERGTEPDLRQRLVYTASPNVPVPDVQPAPAPAVPPVQDLIAPSGETLTLPVDEPAAEPEPDAERLAQVQAAQALARAQAQREEEAQALFAQPGAARTQDVQISLSVQSLPYVDTTRRPGYARESVGAGGVVFAVQGWFPQAAVKAASTPVFTPAPANIAVQVPAPPAAEPAPPAVEPAPPAVQVAPEQPAPPVTPAAPVLASPAPGEARVVPLGTHVEEQFILNAESLLGGDDHVHALDRPGPDTSDDEQLRAMLAEEARRGIQEASERARAQENAPGDPH